MERQSPPRAEGPPPTLCMNKVSLLVATDLQREIIETQRKMKVCHADVVRVEKAIADRRERLAALESAFEATVVQRRTLTAKLLDDNKYGPIDVDALQAPSTSGSGGQAHVSFANDMGSFLVGDYTPKFTPPEQMLRRSPQSSIALTPKDKSAHHNDAGGAYADLSAKQLLKLTKGKEEYLSFRLSHLREENKRFAEGVNIAFVEVEGHPLAGQYPASKAQRRSFATATLSQTMKRRDDQQEAKHTRALIREIGREIKILSLALAKEEEAIRLQSQSAQGSPSSAAKARRLAEQRQMLEGENAHLSERVGMLEGLVNVEERKYNRLREAASQSEKQAQGAEGRNGVARHRPSAPASHS